MMNFFGLMGYNLIVNVRITYLVYIFILVVWAIYRCFFYYPEWVDELIAKPLIFLAPVIFIIIYKERVSLKTLGFEKKKLGRNILIGAGAAFLLIEEYILTYYFKFNVIRVSPLLFQIQGLIPAIVISAATGIVEEAVFRGYFLNRLLKHYGNAVAAVSLSTLFFIIVHLPLYFYVLHFSASEMVVGVLLLLQLSVINSILFIYTKTIAAPAANHTLWNLSQVLLR